MRMNQKWTYFSCFILIMLFSLSGNSQVVVQSRLDKTKIQVGDAVNLRLEVSTGETIRIDELNWLWPDSLDQLEVLTDTPWDTLSQGANNVYRKDFTIVAWDSGTFWIPPIEVPYSLKSTKRSKKTDRIPLEVLSPLADSLEIEPIKPLLEPGRVGLTKTQKVIIIIAIAVLLLIFLIIWLIRRRKNKEEEVVPVIIRPAHEVAREKLNVLDKAQLYQQGNEKEYQSQLTYILREYVEGRFGVRALEQTTDQIIRDIEKLNLSESQVQVLKELLPMADLVKFAKAKPPITFHEKAMVDVRNWVENTIPVVQEELTDEEE